MNCRWPANAGHTRSRAGTLGSIKSPGLALSHQIAKISVAVFCGIIVLVPLGTAAGKDLPATELVQRQHQEAVRLARSGKTAEALRILQVLSHEAPADLSITWDRIVILTWAEKDDEAVTLYESVQQNHAPDYVLEAVARAYDNLRRYPEALRIYRQGHARSPGSAAFAAGEIRTLADMGDGGSALTLAQRVLSKQGDRVEVLLAAADAARESQKPVDALGYADRALKLAPRSRDAVRERILAIEAMGAPEIALQLAEANTGVVSAGDIRRMEGSAAAELVRLGELEPPSEAARFAATDRAIAALDRLIARWSAEGEVAKGDLWRARFDRIIALHDRVRMSDVVSEFEAAQRAKVDIPAYVLPDVADAYLYFRQPEIAVELYRRALEANPKDTVARLGLSQALIETEDFDEALGQVDRVAAGMGPWIYLKGEHEPIPNTDKFDADVAAAYARLYADDLPAAELRFAHMTDLAPNNVAIRVGLADVYRARGWPRLAQQELEIAQAQIPNNLGVEAAEAQGDLDLQDWHGAETKAMDLLRRFPESREVQDLNRAWGIHNRWTLQTSAERTFSSATNIAGGNGISVGAQLYSPPIADDWRAYGGYRLAHAREPEGNVSERLYDTGIEYRGIGVTTSAEARLASFGTERAGGQLAGDWDIDDHWNLSGAGEIFASDTPLRALLHRITADAATVNLGYRASELRDVKATVEVLPFSDGNLRTVLSSHADQRVYTTPHLQLNGTVDLAASQNSSTDEPFFNPRHDALGAGGVDLTHILYRRYDFTYSHRLVATIGPYWEQRFGTGLAWSIRYEQRVAWNDTGEVSVGLSFSRQPFDGEYENDVALTLGSTLRF